MNAIVGKAYSLRFDFTNDGEYIVPDIASVVYTVHDNAGQPMSGYTSVAVTTTSTTDHLSIQIPSAVHTVGGSKLFEQRSVILDYTYQGKTLSIPKHYYVTNRLNYHVSPLDVISCLAIKEGEIFAEEVELVPAYFAVRETMGATAFDAALSSGTITQLKVNEAIKYQAALKFLATLELRAFEKAGGDSASYKRFATVDFAALKQAVKGELAAAIQSASGVSTTPSLFVLSNPTDVYTG